MAPHKLKGTDLNLIQPTPEEIAEARSILKHNSDPVKKEKSAMACFSAWAKANNIPEDVSKSRGEKRREYMESGSCSSPGRRRRAARTPPPRPWPTPHARRLQLMPLWINPWQLQ